MLMGISGSDARPCLGDAAVEPLPCPWRGYCGSNHVIRRDGTVRDGSRTGVSAVCVRGVFCSTDFHAASHLCCARLGLRRRLAAYSQVRSTTTQLVHCGFASLHRTDAPVNQCERDCAYSYQTLMWRLLHSTRPFMDYLCDFRVVGDGRLQQGNTNTRKWRW